MRIATIYHNFCKYNNEAKDMIICAIVIGAADIIVTGVDFAWLIGDYVHASAPHHPYIGIGLIFGLSIMFASFIWLFYALARRARKHAKKSKELHKKLHARHQVHTPSHCDVSPKKKIIKIDYTKYNELYGYDK